MKNNELLFCEDIYLEHLSTINGVKFTPREIDVMACLLSARRTSQIASMLSIAPRTVTTHFRNIMLRLDCNSQEGIINFVERSHKLSILREYYSSLIIELAFKKALKEISKLRKDEGPSCLIVYWQDQILKKSLISHLRNHLTHTGISPEIREQELDRKIENVENPYHTLLTLIEKKDSPDFSQEPIDCQFVDLSKYHNYYLAVFEILQELLPNTDLKSIVKKFREQYEGIHNLSGKKYPQAYKEEKLDINENLIIHKALPILKNRKSYFMSALLVISLFAVGALTFKGNKEGGQNHIQARNAAKGSTIRSDLIIPAETALLHRPELISQIDDKFKEQAGIQTVALVGPGGAGKTTIARQYAHQQKSNVIWEINAETPESLKSSFENLAYALTKTGKDQKILREIQGIKNSTEREEKIIQFVKECLKKHLNWFLTYDNVEKFSDIQRYFPRDFATWGQGKIILTTRDSNIQNNKHINYIIHIRELNLHQKINLFTKIMNQENTVSFTPIQTEEVKAFLEKLPPFPLDISVAVYYLKATNVPYTTYLKNLEKYNKDLSQMQEKLLKEAGDYTKTRYSIVSLSIQKLIDTHKDFADLLLFISLLDSQSIPRDLLQKYKNNLVVDQFIHALKKYSLITNEISLNKELAISIHRSTQAISLSYLSNILKIQNNKKLIYNIAIIIEKHMGYLIDKEDLAQLKAFVGHCETFLSHSTMLTNTISSSVGSELGFIYFYLNKFNKAKNVLEKSIESMKNYCNKFPAKASQAFLHLGIVNREQGNYEQAKVFIDKSLEICINYISSPHINEVWALAHLGIIHRDLGNYNKSKELLEKSLSVYKDISKKNTTDSAWIMALLGTVYTKLGQYEQAKSLFEKSLKIYKNNFGNKHHKTAWVLGNIGIIYKEQKKYEKAMILFEKTLRIFTANCNETQDYICWNLLHLGSVYGELGNYIKAKELIEKSLILHEKTHGKSHIKTAQVLKEIGNIYLQEGSLEKAKKYWRKALEIFQMNKHSESHIMLKNLTNI